MEHNWAMEEMNHQPMERDTGQSYVHIFIGMKNQSEEATWYDPIGHPGKDKLQMIANPGIGGLKGLHVTNWG